MKNHKIAVLLVIAGLCFSSQVHAANCGDTDSDGVTDTVCACGDTVVGAAGYTYELSGDLTCTGHGLVIGADNITIDGNGYDITGDRGTTDYGIYNSDGYDTVIIQDFGDGTDSGINNFRYGVNFANSSGSTIQNNRLISNSTRSVYLNNCDLNTVSGNTATNTMYLLGTSNSDILNNTVVMISSSQSIYLSSSPGNTISGNTTSSGSTGISLSNSSGNTISGNSATSNNTYGIYLSSSPGSILTNNTMSDNHYSLFVTGTVTTDYNNTISNTNLVEGKPVYYLYGASSQTYDGDIIGDIGMFWCISCDDITIQNAVLSENNYYGVFFYDTDNSHLSNITANSNYNGMTLLSSSSNTLTGNTATSNSGTGISLSGSSGNTISENTVSSNTLTGISLSSSSSNNLTGNTVNSNKYGITLNGSDGNTLSGNTTNLNIIFGDDWGMGMYLLSSSGNNITSNVSQLNNYGIRLSSSSSNTLMGNIISTNIEDINDNGSNTYQGNLFSYNTTNKMISFTDTDRSVDVGGAVNFTIAMKNLDGTDCDDCTYSVTVSPSETFTPIKTDNNLTGTFNVSKNGLYSLLVQITDSNNNVAKENYLFFIDSEDRTIRYYFRGLDLTHSQIGGPANDTKALLLQLSLEQEAPQFCSSWSQTVVDDIPDFPLVYIYGINSNFWYRLLDTIGIRKYVAGAMDYTIVDQSQAVPWADNYTFHNGASFSDVNWTMQYPRNWYWLTLVFSGGGSFVINFPSAEYSDQPSYTDFNCKYTITPAIKSISSPYIILLSATEPVDEPGSATIVLDGTGATDTTTDIVLGDYNRPFAGYITTINSDGTATLHATGIDTEVTVNSVNMGITPDSGSVDVQIALWNPYYSAWTEDASEGGITATHVIGGLMPNIYYEIRKNGISIGSYLSDANGEITFSCVAGSIFTMEGIVTIDETDGDNEDDNEKHCFIATAAYGTTTAKEVQTLRQFRNEYLLVNPVGERFVSSYYKISPHIAEFVKRHTLLKKFVSSALKPLVWIIEKSTE